MSQSYEYSSLFLLLLIIIYIQLNLSIPFEKLDLKSEAPVDINNVNLKSCIIFKYYFIKFYHIVYCKSINDDHLFY